jgi:homoserine dehydrogenase
VVTANKQLIAQHGEAGPAAREGGPACFEAAVAGAIPVIRVCRRVRGDPDRKVFGIVNGTTNYILTEMAAAASYDEALKQAQDLHAEATRPTTSGAMRGEDGDPGAPAFGAPVKLADVPYEGIEQIKPDDLPTRRSWSLLKLLGVAERSRRGDQRRVFLASLPHPLALIEPSTP